MDRSTEKCQSVLHNVNMRLVIIFHLPSVLCFQHGLHLLKVGR